MTTRTATTTTPVNNNKKRKQKSAKKPRWNTLPPKQLETKIAEREARQIRAKRLAEDKSRAAANLGNGEFARNVGHKGKKNKRRHRDIAGDMTPPDKSGDLEGGEGGRAAKRQARGPQQGDQDDVTMADTSAGGEGSAPTQAELDQAAIRRARDLVAEEMRKAQAVTAAQPVAIPALPSPASDSMDMEADLARGTSMHEAEPVDEQGTTAIQEDAVIEEAILPAGLLAGEPVEMAVVETAAVSDVAPIPFSPTPQEIPSTDETPVASTELATTTIVTTPPQVAETSAPVDLPIDDATTATTTTTTSPPAATTITTTAKRTTTRKTPAPALATTTKRTTRSTARKLAGTGSGEDTV